MDIQFYVNVLTDASAALGIISRRAIGKVRHLETSNLWIQELVAIREVTYDKVIGTANPADMMTKYMFEFEIAKYMQMIGANFARGRADIAAQVARDEGWHEQSPEEKGKSVVVDEKIEEQISSRSENRDNVLVKRFVLRKK